MYRNPKKKIDKCVYWVLNRWYLRFPSIPLFDLFGAYFDQDLLEMSESSEKVLWRPQQFSQSLLQPAHRAALRGHALLEKVPGGRWQREMGIFLPAKNGMIPSGSQTWQQLSQQQLAFCTVATVAVTALKHTLWRHYQPCQKDLITGKSK